MKVVVNGEEVEVTLVPGEHGSRQLKTTKKFDNEEEALAFAKAMAEAVINKLSIN
jgi:type IV secretory pathway ATPase VirB11/archaellum biosynthesis ATPase